MNMQVLDARRDVSGGYKVDVSRGERVGRVSSEWFSRPDDERYLSLGDLARSVRGRSERSRTRVVETALIHVEANRNDPERLSLILPGADVPVAPTHWSFGQLASQVGAPAAYLRQLPAPLAAINLQYGLAATRAGLLAMLFPGTAVTRFDAAQIDDHLDATVAPSVVLMNPPFSAMAHVAGRVQDAGFRHISSALRRLAPGGRLVTITGANVGPDTSDWREAFVSLQARARVVFSCPIAGALYARHGTTFPTRLTVIDKLPANDPSMFPPSPGSAPDVATLLGWIETQVPPRLPVTLPATTAQLVAMPKSVRGYLARSASKAPASSVAVDPESLDLAYEVIDWTPPEDARISENLYEGYTLQSICIPGSQPHPTKLVQSAAMASVAPPKPTYRPRLPANIHALLSDAQLETVIYAGEAHSDYLTGSWTVDETFDLVQAAPEGAPATVRFRRGFMLGDGTGAGKGRQSAGIILDNWLQGRRKAVWISKSDKLIEDAQRGSVAKIVKLEHAWRRLDGRNDDGFQVAPFPG